MVLKSIVACAIVILVLFVALGLVRIAANIVITLLAIGGCTQMIYQILYEGLDSWLLICAYAAGTGFLVALLSLPVLPFSSFHKKH